MPRHPPCALSSLSQQKHLLTKNKSLQRTTTPPQQPGVRPQRCSRPLCSSQTTTQHHPATPTTNNTAAGATTQAARNKDTGPRQELDPSGPNSVPTPTPGTGPAQGSTPTPRAGSTTRQRTAPQAGLLADVPPSKQRPAAGHPPTTRCLLLRKEVIQPHLPVRLPCYDFVPIASPTFDGSLPQGVGPPASGVADFRDVTGGVYKARERIHRSVADLRLLATPTSWGRVADPNPN